MPILAPSILAADMGRLEAHAREAVEAGADWLHIDVMDGHFVPNLTFGPIVVEALKPLADETETLLDVHLMMENPENYIDEFVDAGADLITVHIEAANHLHRVIEEIQSHGVRAGVSLNPGTALNALDEILWHVDLILLMSVNPGFAGQSYISRSTLRIQRLRRMLNAMGSRPALLSVDGGLKPENAADIVGAGADVLVAGSAVFNDEAPVEENMNDFRSAFEMHA